MPQSWLLHFFRFVCRDCHCAPYCGKLTTAYEKRGKKILWSCKIFPSRLAGSFHKVWSCNLQPGVLTARTNLSWRFLRRSSYRSKDSTGSCATSKQISLVASSALVEETEDTFCVTAPPQRCTAIGSLSEDHKTDGRQCRWKFEFPLIIGNNSTRTWWNMHPIRIDKIHLFWLSSRLSREMNDSSIRTTNKSEWHGVSPQHGCDWASKTKVTSHEDNVTTWIELHPLR